MYQRMLVAIGLGVAAAGQARPAPAPATVFVVQPSFESVSLLPVLVVDGAALKEPAAKGFGSPENDKFAEVFYRSGGTYRLLFGGGEAGTVVVRRDRRDSECGKSTADAALKVTAEFNQKLYSLATDSPSIGKGARVRRAPTDAERTEALRLAAEAFAKSGARGARTVVNLTAVDVDRDGKAELVGTFLMIWGGAAPGRESLFLVAEPQGAGYRAAIAETSRVKPGDVMGGVELADLGDRLMTRFVDQIDLDGDGTAEILTTMTSFEGEHFHVYKRDKGAWTQVYKFYSYRCAF